MLQLLKIELCFGRLVSYVTVDRLGRGPEIAELLARMSNHGGGPAFPQQEDGPRGVAGSGQPAGWKKHRQIERYRD